MTEEGLSRVWCQPHLSEPRAVSVGDGKYAMPPGHAQHTICPSSLLQEKAPVLHVLEEIANQDPKTNC